MDVVLTALCEQHICLPTFHCDPFMSSLMKTQHSDIDVGSQLYVFHIRNCRREYQCMNVQADRCFAVTRRDGELGSGDLPHDCSAL